MARQVIKEYKSEIKLLKNIYLSDLVFIMCYVAFMYVIGMIFVDSSLNFVYMIFNVIIGILLTRKSSQNPRVKKYRELTMMAKRDSLVYESFDAKEYRERMK